jgi:hypothetical protein
MSSDGNERGGLSFEQWGILLNGSLILLILSLMDTGAATLALEVVLSAIGGIGFWMFFDTVPEDFLEPDDGQEADQS